MSEPRPIPLQEALERTRSLFLGVIRERLARGHTPTVTVRQYEGDEFATYAWSDERFADLTVILAPSVEVPALVPTDLVLALARGSAAREAYQRHLAEGCAPKVMARVFTRGGRYFAVVDFAGGDGQAVQLPLDVRVG